MIEKRGREGSILHSAENCNPPAIPGNSLFDLSVAIYIIGLGISRTRERT